MLKNYIKLKIYMLPVMVRTNIEVAYMICQVMHNKSNSIIGSSQIDVVNLVSQDSRKFIL
jgi:hypothetical protein